MTDILGNEIQIGDKVVSLCLNRYGNELDYAIVSGMTKDKLKCVCKSIIHNKETKGYIRNSGQVCKLGSL